MAESKTNITEKKSPRTHTVVKGDTLRSISAKYLGKASRADEIRRLNNLATDILKIGRVLNLPEK